MGRALGKPFDPLSWLLMKYRTAVALLRYGSIMAVVSVSACEKPTPTPQADSSAEVVFPQPDDSTVVVRIDQASLNAKPIPLEPSVTIGSGKSGANDEFGWIAGIAIDSDGRFFVSDPMSSRLRVYDSAGEFVRDIGRKGGGPGEFLGLHGDNTERTISGIALIGDTLIIVDAHRLVALDTTGKYLFATPADLVFSNALGVTPGHAQVVITRRKNQGTNNESFVFSQYDL
jgi:hypothetical protein